MEDIIRSRKDIKRQKDRILKEIKYSGNDFKTHFILSLNPKEKTATGKRLNYNKLINYAVLGYKGFMWFRRFRAFWGNNKKKSKRRR